MIANAFTPDEDIKHWGLRATITYEADPFTIELTSSYRDLLRNYDANVPLSPFYPGVIEDLSQRDNIFTPDPDDLITDDIILQENLDNFSRFQFITDSESYYNELRIFNSDGPFIWSLGAMYFKEEQYSFLGSTGDRGLFFQGVEFNNPDVDSESWSVYGDITYEVTEDFRITGGIRYTDDEKSRQGVAARYGFALGGAGFSCCGGVRYGTEGFEFAAQDRTIFDPDTNGDGSIDDNEVLAFFFDGIGQLGLRDNVDEVFANGAFGGGPDDIPNRTPCVDTISFDNFFCDASGNFLFGVPFANQIFQQDGQIQDNFIDWRARLEYDITPDNLIYALVASGHNQARSTTISAPMASCRRPTQRT